MVRQQLFSIPLVVAGLAACAHHDGAQLSTAAAATPELQAAGLLAFLNDPHTDLRTLDEQVGLDRRAATSLVQRRAGQDGQHGSADDRPFHSLDEVDAVAWVGPVSIQRMSSYASSRGYMDDGHLPLGTWDQVSFTRSEARCTLALVNDASAHGLDRWVPLDRRAVESVLRARPIASMEQLSELYFIGPHAMSALKRHACPRRASLAQGVELH